MGRSTSACSMASVRSSSRRSSVMTAAAKAWCTAPAAPVGRRVGSPRSCVRRLHGVASVRMCVPSGAERRKTGEERCAQPEGADGGVLEDEGLLRDGQLVAGGGEAHGAVVEPRVVAVDALAQAQHLLHHTHLPVLHMCSGSSAGPRWHSLQRPSSHCCSHGQRPPRGCTSDLGRM